MTTPTAIALRQFEAHSHARTWAEAYEQGWRDRNEYGRAESWPFVFDTPNPYVDENGDIEQ